MQGILAPQPQDEQPDAATRWKALVREQAHRYRAFLLVVIGPLLLVSAFFYLVASNQYQSEAHFLVKTFDKAPVGGIGLSQALSQATGLSAAQNEAMSVADYLSSHDVVETLQKRLDLVAMFQRSGVDFVSRLHGSDPTPERLLKYYRSHVFVKYNTETGITTIEVRSFAPADSYRIIQELLKLGEERVNQLNNRSYNDSLSQAAQLLLDTESALAKNQFQMTHFRQQRGDIDPQASGTAQITLVSKLTGDLAAARAQLSAIGAMVSRRSPQYLALQSHVNALQAQVDSEGGRLVGSGQAIAGDISGYEDLKMRQGFLMKRYDSAAASLDKAREQAQHQQLYVVRIVEPNMPVKSLYPERGRIVITVAVALFLAYGIGWLIIAGVREHAL